MFYVCGCLSDKLGNDHLSCFGDAKKKKNKKKNRIFVMVKLVLTNLGKLMCNCMYRLGLFQTDVCGWYFSGLVEYLDSDDY